MIRYGELYKGSQASNSLYILCGPAKSGKSVTIDLLTDKVIRQLEVE